MNDKPASGLEPTTAPADAHYALWARDWHRIEPNATKTCCGRTLPYAKVVHFQTHEHHCGFKCRVCFP